MEMLRTMLVWFVSVVVLVGCLAVPLNPGLRPEEESDDLQTLTSIRHGFSVRLPAGWQMVELPTAEYPTATDQVWFVSETLPPAQTGARADIVLLFTQEDPSSSWLPEYFDEYRLEEFDLSGLPGRRITGINKESRAAEMVVLARVGDYHVQALSNQSKAALMHFDQVVASLRFAPAPQATYSPQSQDSQAITFGETHFICPTWLAERTIVQRIPKSTDPSGFTYNDMPEHVRFDMLDSYAVHGPLADLRSLWVPWLKHQTLDSPDIRPQIFILPAGEYAAISPLATERIERLRALLNGAPLEPGEDLPVLPTFNSAQDLHGQVEPVAFDGGRGLRFIARYSQESMPVINPAIFYTFQGLTDDGRHYVAAFFPLYLAVLPNEINVEDWEAFNTTYAAYLTETKTALEQLSPSDFDPDLTLLDGVVASLHVDQASTCRQTLPPSSVEVRYTDLVLEPLDQEASDEPELPGCRLTDLRPFGWKTVDSGWVDIRSSAEYAVQVESLYQEGYLDYLQSHSEQPERHSASPEMSYEAFLATCNVFPEVDFERYSLLGAQAMGTGCTATFEKHVFKDDAHKKVRYEIEVIEEGTCEAVWLSRNLILVPRIAPEYEVEFVIQSRSEP